MVDPRRRAADTIRGFVFQLWHSVHAWLELREGDQLFLEGAEDLDVVRGSDAFLTQTKATKAGISLRSVPVLEAIRNFWFACEQNPNIQIRYRFVSTSPVAKEIGAPFGQSGGLDLWNECRGNEATVENIRRFLLGEKYFVGNLLTFVASSTPKKLFQDLIARISWDVDQPESPSVIDAIKRKLVLHGDTYSVLPSESEKVAAPLLQAVADVASARQPRSLRYEDFLSLFETETHRSVPAAQGRVTLDAVALLLSADAIGGSQLVVSAQSSIQPKPPPLPIVAMRPDLVHTLRGTLAKHGFLLLYGSSGTGKTILAALVSRDKSGLAWLNMRGFDSHGIRGALNQLARFVDADPTINSIVFDDLDLSPGIIDECRGLLPGLIYTLRARRGQLLITSQRRLPQTLSQILGLAPDANATVPSLSAAEIEEVALQLGCPASEAGIQGKMIALQTRGHPQLAHARLLTLAQINWPLPAGDDFLSVPKEIAQVRSEVRQLLQGLRDGALELLYRLSLIGGLFRRDQAVMIGGIKPEISAPGDVFDSLAGPWIEGVSEKYFRLSPLLENSAREAWPKQKIDELRETVEVPYSLAGI